MIVGYEQCPFVKNGRLCLLTGVVTARIGAPVPPRINRLIMSLHETTNQGNGEYVDLRRRTDEASHLVMLRDPWGLALQPCRRAQPLA